MRDALSDLSHNDLLYWRRRLEERKTNVTLTKNALKKHALSDLSTESTGEISKIRLHSADLATNAQDIETLESLSERNIFALKEIEAALVRLENGTFGTCEQCLEPIPKGRLQLIPEARFCCDCQEEIEMEHAQIVQDKSALKDNFSPEVLNSLKLLKVSDAMQDRPITIRGNESLYTAATLFADHNFRHLPVVDSANNIQGVLSDRDLLRLLLGGLRSWVLQNPVDDNWIKQRVDSLMTKAPETVTAETALNDAGALFIENKISCLPVVEGNRLVGILTEFDFVKLVSGLTSDQF